MSYADMMSVGTAPIQTGAVNDKPKLVTSHLEEIYNTAVRPLEEVFGFENYYHSKPVSQGFFESAPLLLVLGPKNAGKTSFIRQMIGRDFPGMVLGEDKHTQLFTFIQSGSADQVIPGDFAALAEDSNLKGLAKLGEEFANSYVKVKCVSEALEPLWFVDTPRFDNKFSDIELKALKWFAKVAWKIIVIFDATRLRFGIETRDNLSFLFKYREKMHFILNKSQKVRVDSLMPQYGKLLSCLHNTFKHPDFDFEPLIYVTSFPGFEEEFDPNRPLFKKLTKDSTKVFETLWKAGTVGADMKIFQIEKRVKQALNHAEIMLLLRDKVHRINRRKGKPDWSSSVRDLLNKILSQLKNANPDFDENSIKVEAYLQALEDERFKFSKDRKRVDKTVLVLTTGLPILRKELYGTKSVPEVERKLGRLGLLKISRKRQKSHVKQIKAEKQLHRQSSMASTLNANSGRNSRTSTSSFVSPLPAFNSGNENMFGRSSMQSESSYNPRHKSRVLRNNTVGTRRNMHQQHFDTFSVGSEDVYSNYRGSRRVKSVAVQGSSTLAMNVGQTGGQDDTQTNDDPLDLFGSGTEDEFDSQKSGIMSKNRMSNSPGPDRSHILEKKMSLPPIKSNAPSHRKQSQNSFAAQYSICKVISRFFSRGNENNQGPASL